MNIIVINYCHPKAKHICGQRALNFSKELSKKNHKVCLITSDFNVKKSKKINIYNKNFIHFAYKSSENKKNQRIIKNNFLNKIYIVFNFLFKSGQKYKWIEDIDEKFYRFIKYKFKPNYIIAIYSPIDCVYLGAKISQLTNAELILDIKDPFVESNGLFFSLFFLNKYRFVKKFSFLSKKYKDEFNKLTNKGNLIIRSGLNNNFLNNITTNSHKVDIQINIIGSIYHQDYLNDLLNILNNFSLRINKKIKVVYLGNNFSSFKEFLKNKINIKILNKGMVSYKKYFDEIKNADLNCYINHKKTFHTKFYELISLGKPILSYPFSNYEEKEIVKKYSIPFFSGNNTNVLNKILDDVLIKKKFKKGKYVINWKDETNKFEKLFN